jgi:ribosome biogenesis SPOUT family RNA methylase Rps3
MTKVITISVKNEEEWIIEELKKIAKKKGMPLSQIVIDAVKEEIKKYKQ